MGTWCSANPRGQFGAQAGGVIFTSTKHISPRHWLGGTGFGERVHPVPGSQPFSGHVGDPQKEGYGCINQIYLRAGVPDFQASARHRFSPLTPAQHKSQWALLLKSKWPAPVLTWSTFISPENYTSLLHGDSIWAPANGTQTKPCLYCHPASFTMVPSPRPLSHISLMCSLSEPFSTPGPLHSLPRRHCSSHRPEFPPLI